MSPKCLAFLALVLLLLSSRSALAQGPGSFEFGMDTGFNLAFIDDEDENVFSVGVPGAVFGTSPNFILFGPLQNWRIAYQTSETISLEVPFGFSLLSVSGDSYWRLGAGLGVLYNFPRKNDSQFFLSGNGLINVTGYTAQTDSQFGVSAAPGARFFLGDSWALRVEAGAARMFSTNDLNGTWNVVGSIGLSFFTHPAGK